MADEKTNEIRRIATDIVCAEVANGHRTFWIYDFTDSKMDRIIDASIMMAEKVYEKTEKYNPENDK